MFTLAVSLILKQYANKIKKDFNTTKIEYKFLDREHDLKELHTLTYTDPIAKNYENKEIDNEK
jgi:hypothetical protein